jgi:ribosomal protein S18 acetylase RimI-like enzyme
VSRVSVQRRPARDSDQAIARQIHHRAFRDVVERQFGSWDEAAQDDFFDREWDRQAHEILVVDGEPAGYAAVEHRDDHIFIHNIVLDPAAQGRGAGTALLIEILDAGRATSRTVRLQVLHENRAVGLYRRLGFSETERTPTHLLMERDAS